MDFKADIRIIKIKIRGMFCFLLHILERAWRNAATPLCSVPLSGENMSPSLSMLSSLRIIGLSTLYSLHFTVYTLQSTLYTLQSTLYTLQSTLYTLQSKLFTLRSTLNTLQCSLQTFHYTVYTVQRKL